MMIVTTTEAADMTATDMILDMTIGTTIDTIAEPATTEIGGTTDDPIMIGKYNTHEPYIASTSYRYFLHVIHKLYV